MNFYSEIVSAVFSVILLSWILVEIMSGSRRRNARSRGLGEGRGFSLFTLILNVMISVLYLGFVLFDYFNYKTIKSKSFFSAITWFLASLVAVFTILNHKKRWPLVLIFWWVFSTIIGFLSVSRYLFEFLKSIEIPAFFPQASMVDAASFPFSLLLCFNLFGYTKNDNDHYDLQEPMLQNQKDESQVFTRAGIWSRISFQWLNELFKTGRVQKLEFSHVPSVPQSERADTAANVLEQSLGHQKTEDASLTIAILHATWKSLAINAVFAGINTAASYTGPFLITNLVNYLLEKSEGSRIEYGLLLAFIIFASKTLESITQRQWYFGAHRIGLRVQAALTVLIYKTCISMKYSGPNNGKIVNLINVDVERIGDCCLHIHGVWLLPLQVFLAFAILYGNLGAAPAFATLLTTVLVVVCNVPLVKMQKSFESNIMEAKDSRIKMTSEILKSMRVLKLHGWEQRFLMKLLQLREIERSWLKRYLYTCSAVAFLFWTSPTLVAVVTFGVCILLKTPLTAGTVLSALATLRILQEAIYNLPELISVISRTKVSIYRVYEFIKEDQRNKPIHCYTSEASSNIGIEIEKGEYTWKTSDQNLNEPVLKIMEKLSVKEGYKVAICGSVGSGKSSLLYSMLDEIPRISGTGIKVYGTKAIVPQTSWIQTGTVRDNVLFGKNMDGAFYEHVLKACALDQDIRTWANGDLSLIGERGINLSGGQKQRIQLARAVYSDSDVYFLDDPFSAVDAHTGTHLFKKCLMQLLSKKTVVYTTHQLEFLEAADLVLVMKDGVIAQSGTLENLIKNPRGELVTQLAAHKKSINKLKACQKDNPYGSASHAGDIEELEEQQKEPLSNGKLLEKTLEEEEEEKEEDEDEEEAETGCVKWRVYSTFLTSAYGGALIPVILLCHIFFQGLQMASNYWLAWATEKQGRVSSDKQLIGIFILLSFGSSVFILGRAVFLSTLALETAKNLFHGMTTAIFRAPISFFDSTPSSRILSRCSTDQSTIDINIPYRVAGLVFAIIQLFFVIVLMSQVAWEIFLLFIVVIGISVWYQNYYITTSRELARMVGIKKAPILHHFSESITGAAIIRCFNQEDRFLMKILSRIDDYSRVTFHNAATMEWLSVRTNFLFNLVFFLVLIILVSLPPSSIDPSLAGLAATYGLNLNVLQAWIIWNLCNVKNKMISVERILQFTNIPSEAPLVIEECKPNPEWPTDGRIELENLHVQYNPDLPMVLKGITCTFPGEKKIGIVGRTGSGKSTLIQALFRVVEPSGGQILIDGVDISKIGLQDLRSRLGIIPQDPTLFQGTIRTNLDPLQQHSDQEIWEVLNKCRLAEIIRQDRRLLDAPVSEDGQNWSVGQRQLVCLARVLMNKRKILVLDEATASIDTASDNFIQQMIREDTSGCTVITVAHRIPTVIESDLVLVLNEGNIVEYDTPSRLLEDSSSSFSKLVAEFSRRSSRRTWDTS